MGLPNCRLCGSKPKYVSEIIVPPDLSMAIHCSNADCYNDTHWQNSWHQATEIWHENPCPVDIRGGQGIEGDDRNILQLNLDKGSDG